MDEVLSARALRSLTDRDRSICHLLEHHRVLTIHQLTDAYFGSYERARHRLTILHELRLVGRFRPYRLNGSAPYHYTLDVLGEIVCAAERGEEPSKFSGDVALRWQRSSHLDHLIAVNSFFTSLMAAARRSGDAELAEWWSERRCAKAMAGLVYPDGYGIWREGSHKVEFCVEVDRGTETVARVVGKLAGYEALERTSGVKRWVLLGLPTPRREAEIRRALWRTPVPVATAVVGRSPTEAVWLPVGGGNDRRVRLVALGQPLG